MTSDPNIAANQIANRARHQVTNVLHILAALHNRTPDGYPGGSGGDGRSSGISDPTAGAALNRTEGTGTGYRTADLHELILDQLAIQQASLDITEQLFAMLVRAQATPQDRCAGTISPTCTNLRDGNPDHHGLCVTCTTTACRGCWKRAKAQRRSGITGELICETCRSAERRAS